MFIGNLTHKGIRTESAAATFNCDNTLSQDSVGMLVTIKGNFTVGLAGDDDVIFGVLESYEDRVTEGAKLGAVGWQICFSAPYEGTAPVAGQGLVGSATAGTVKASATATNVIVTNVDTSAGEVEFIIR